MGSGIVQRYRGTGVEQVSTWVHVQGYYRLAQV